MPTADVQKLGPVAVERALADRIRINKINAVAVEILALRGITRKLGPAATLRTYLRGETSKIGAVAVVRPFEVGRRRPLYIDMAYAASAPVFTLAPAVTTDTGFFGVGDTATVTFAIDGGTASIQWTRAGLPILGATGASYTYQLADVGSVVQARVTARAVVPSLVTVATSVAGAAIVEPVFDIVYRVTASGDIRVDAAGNSRITGITRTA